MNEGFFSFGLLWLYYQLLLDWCDNSMFIRGVLLVLEYLLNSPKFSELILNIPTPNHKQMTTSHKNVCIIFGIYSLFPNLHDLLEYIRLDA